MALRSERKIVEDIVPNKRTIRNLSLEERRESPARSSRTRARAEEVVEDSYDSSDEEIKVPIHIKKIRRAEIEKEINSSYRDNPRKKRRFSGTVTAFVVIFLCIALIAVALSLFYSKAVVTIIPKIAPIEVNGTFTAKKNAGSSEISYEIITRKDKASMPVTASKGPLVETKAKGTAYLYNEQAVAQTIVAGTRLSNSEGLVYRTSSTVSIPAKKSTGPGSVSVAITASEAGEEYNMSLSDLTGDLKVVAYEGGDKYTKVYGRTKTDITGGFSGNKTIIASEVRDSVAEELKKTLKEKLSGDLRTSLDKESLVYDDSIVFDYQISDSEVDSASGKAEVIVNATAYGITFKRDDLLKFIGTKELEKFPVDTYETRGLDELSFSIVNTKDFSATKENPLIFNLKGPLSLIGTFPEDALKNELKDLELDQSNAVFAKYSAIGSAHVLITPFWMRSFPSSTEKIIIDIKSE